MATPEEKIVFETKVSLPTTATLLIAFITGIIAFAIWTMVMASAHGQSEDAALTRFWGTIGILAGYLLLNSPFLINYLKLSKIKWTITDKQLIIKRGYLFTNRYYHLSPDQIFQATYNQGVISKLFNFGTVNVQKSNGLGSYESQIRIVNPGKCAEAINTLVKDYKAYSVVNNMSNHVSAANNSSIDELEKLIRLKEEGKISEEDFQIFKSKLLK